MSNYVGLKKHSMDPYGQVGMKPTLKHPNSPRKSKASLQANQNFMESTVP